MYKVNDFINIGKIYMSKIVLFWIIIVFYFKINGFNILSDGVF